MALTRDNHNVTVDGRPVRVTGRTGPVRATWSLLEGDTVLAEEEVLGGEMTLTGTLTTGTEVTAVVTQSAFGPTKVVVSSGGETVAQFDGFVA